MQVMMARTFGMKSEPSPPHQAGRQCAGRQEEGDGKNQEEYARSQIPELFQEHCFDPSFLCLSFHSCCLIRITLLYTGTPYVHCDGNTRIRRYLMSLIHFHKYST